jgi:replicative DNA helicase
MNEEIFGRVPPHNIEAEQATLGSILIDNEAIYKVIDFLEPNHFYRTSHQIIYETMIELFERNEPIDLLTLSEELKKKGKLEEVGGFSYLATLTNITPTALNIDTYAKIVEEKAVLRELIKAGIDIINLAFQQEEDSGTILDKSQEILYQIAKKRMSTPFYPLKELLKESFDRIESLYKEKKSFPGIPTHFKKLDEILGGFHKNDLIILAARPSLGKTSLSINICLNIALKEKIPVAIFSLEMSKEQIVERILESVANVNFHKLKTSLLSDNDWVKLGRAYGPLYEAPIFIDDSSDISILEIRTKARRLKNQNNLGMIVIDYLQLMHLKTKVENRVQEISELTRNLKKLARELEIPVLVISQLSRAIEKRENKRPLLSDLRESGCLTKDTLLITGETKEYINLKDIVDGKYKLPIEVLSLDENRLKIKKAKLVKAFSSGIKKVYLLKTEGEREIKASSNHPFFTFDGWKRLDQLKLGEKILVPILDESKNDNPSNSYVFWDKVKNIVEIGEEEVFDATIEETHNFIANNIFVHNSIEQDADVVMFLNKDEDDIGKEQTIVELIVAKNRNGPLGKLRLKFLKNYAKFTEIEYREEERGEEIPF